MNLRTQFSWILVIIFATLFAIVTFLWVKDEQRIHAGAGNITATRDAIREDCAREDATGKAACAQDLQDLSDMLANIHKAPAGTTATSTPATGTLQGNGSFQVAPGAIKVNP